jgi:hypothetical protein
MAGPHRHGPPLAGSAGKISIFIIQSGESGEAALSLLSSSSEERNISFPPILNEGFGNLSLFFEFLLLPGQNFENQLR